MFNSMSKMMEAPDRFNFNATTHEEARQYMFGRARQLLEHRALLTSMSDVEEGIWAFFNMNGVVFQAIYVLEQFRGKGKFAERLKKGSGFPVITLDACRMEPWLLKHGVRHVCLRSNDTPEYRAIAGFYGAAKAKRSGVMYMNHIDEGLAVLQWIGAPRAAKAAYCLHPIVQTDHDLSTSWYKRNTIGLNRCSAQSILLAMEYRSVANEYLSDRTISSISEIRMSPIAEVRDMLIADKVQNRKDFELHHAGTHARSKELTKYFRLWLDKLEVSEEQYQQYKEWLMAPDAFVKKEN